MITKAFNEALSYYPELEGVPIALSFKKIGTSMQAWPDLSLRRSYTIYVNNNKGKRKGMSHDNYKALVGKFGHELAHILDYEDRSFLNLLYFGFAYRFSPMYRKYIERKMDTITITHGLSRYLYISNQFVLDSDVWEKYKMRIKKYNLKLSEIEAFLDKLE